MKRRSSYTTIQLGDINSFLKDMLQVNHAVASTSSVNVNYNGKYNTLYETTLSSN